MAAYALHFLTDEWVWEEAVAAEGAEAAMERARAGLETVVREEAPQLACVTLFEGERRLGVWDWIDGQSVWSAA
jgi:hypothetical protein